MTATSGGGWKNTAFSAQTGTFTVSFDVTPSATPNNALVGLSNGAQTAYTGFGCLVRFNTNGQIDARNGGAFTAAATVPFTANKTYHFVEVVNVTNHTYTIYVTPAGGSQVTLGLNYAFRTEQNTVTSLSSYGAIVETTANGGAGSLTVCNFNVIPPPVTITSATGFYNAALPAAQTGTFTAEFDASPSLSPSDAVIALSAGNAAAYTDMAVMARFNPTGGIDARNGSGFAANSTIPYTAGSTYHFRLVINVPSHTYAVYVKPLGGAETVVGLNYAFRTEQAGVTSLAKWNACVNASPGGSLTVRNFTLGGPPPNASAPVFSPGAGTYATAQTVTMTSSTPGAAIRYTTNGSTPSRTNGTLYTGPVKIEYSLTLRAIAYADGYADSAVTTGAYTITGFIHPGVSVNRAQLDLIKSRVAQGIEPQASAYSLLISDRRASLNYTAVPYQQVKCSYCCPYTEQVGCNHEQDDSIAAYSLALRWYISGDSAYAEKAISIMNGWANTLTGGHTNQNADLQASWTGTQWARAGEIILYTYNGWGPAAVAKFKDMLRTQYLPYLPDLVCKNGNWEQSKLGARMSIAVFLDDRAAFNQALDSWRNHTRAYYYLTSDGPTPITPGGSACTYDWAKDWRYNSTDARLHNGQCQETCRDLGHMQFGFAATFDVANTARQQRVDLFIEEATRLTTMMEFHAAFLNGGPVPADLCGGSLSSVNYSNSWGIAYNYYHNVLFYNLPQSDICRQAAGLKTPVFHFGWEKLTHGDVGAVGLPPRL